MVRKFLIQDWDKFTETEQSNLRELIAISIRAKEIRSELLDLADDEDTEKSQPEDDNSLANLAVILRDVEVTANQNDREALPIERVLPRIGTFLEVKVLTGNNCEKSCNAEFPKDKQKRDECKKKCKIQKTRVAEEIVNSMSRILEE